MHRQTALVVFVSLEVSTALSFAQTVPRAFSPAGTAQLVGSPPPQPRFLFAQFQNPAGFQNPLGANRAGTGNPPNTTIGPLTPSSTLPPGAPSWPREIETNPALRQEVRRPFGGGGYRRRAERPVELDAEPGASRDGQASAAQITALAEANIERSKPGPATGKWAADWRYAYFQGRHWYWMPAGTWDVWTGTNWVPHKPGMFAKPYFGYGTQVRGYRIAPPNYKYGYARPDAPPSDAEKPAGLAGGDEHTAKPLNAVDVARAIAGATLEGNSQPTESKPKISSAGEGTADGHNKDASKVPPSLNQRMSGNSPKHPDDLIIH